MSVLLLFWQIGAARAMRDGEARLVVAAAEARAYALHHWLHDARDGPGFVPPASGKARRLTDEEARRLANHPASPPVLTAPRGWEVTEMIALPEGPEGQGGDPLPHGIVVIKAEIDGEIQHRQIKLIRNALAAGRPGETAKLAEAASDFEPADDIAIFAWPYGRIDPRFVLRSRRAGHPAPHMLFDLKMGGNNVTGVGALEAAGSAALSGETRADGSLTVAGTVNTGPGTEAGAGLSVTGLARAGDVDVTGALTVGTTAGLERLTAKDLEVEDSFRCGACP